MLTDTHLGIGTLGYAVFRSEPVPAPAASPRDERLRSGFVQLFYVISGFLSRTRIDGTMALNMRID